MVDFAIALPTLPKNYSRTLFSTGQNNCSDRVFAQESVGVTSVIKDYQKY